MGYIPPDAKWYPAEIVQQISVEDRPAPALRTGPGAAIEERIQVTDQQIIAIAITVLAVLAGSIFSSVRISDLNTNLSGRIAETNASLNRRIDDLRDVLRAGMRADMTKVEAKLDTIITMLGHLDTRVTKLEEKRASG
jgi:hypothetical protein